MQVHCKCTCWTPDGIWKGPMRYGLSVLPFWGVTGCFLGVGSLDFS